MAYWSAFFGDFAHWRRPRTRLREVSSRLRPGNLLSGAPWEDPRGTGSTGSTLSARHWGPQHPPLEWNYCYLILTRIQKHLCIPPLANSTLIPPAGFSLSEDVDTTPSFILTEYDLDLRVLRGCYEGLKSPNKAETNTRNRPPVRGSDSVHDEHRARFLRTLESPQQWRSALRAARWRLSADRAPRGGSSGGPPPGRTPDGPGGLLDTPARLSLQGVSGASLASSP